MRNRLNVPIGEDRLVLLGPGVVARRRYQTTPTARNAGHEELALHGVTFDAFVVGSSRSRRRVARATSRRRLLRGGRWHTAASQRKPSPRGVRTGISASQCGHASCGTPRTNGDQRSLWLLAITTTDVDRTVHGVAEFVTAGVSRLHSLSGIRLPSALQPILRRPRTTQIQARHKYKHDAQLQARRASE